METWSEYFWKTYVTWTDEVYRGHPPILDNVNFSRQACLDLIIACRRPEHLCPRLSGGERRVSSGEFEARVGVSQTIEGSR